MGSMRRSVSDMRGSENRFVMKSIIECHKEYRMWNWIERWYEVFVGVNWTSELCYLLWTEVFCNKFVVMPRSMELQIVRFTICQEWYQIGSIEVFIETLQGWRWQVILVCNNEKMSTECTICCTLIVVVRFDSDQRICNLRTRWLLRL